MLYCNLFADGGALLETVPQGDASMPVNVGEKTAEALAKMLTTPERSAALAQLFLAGATAGERSVRRGAT
jgi:hypothetical protein